MYTIVYFKRQKRFYGTGIDISKDCIDISKINAKNLELSTDQSFLNQMLTICLTANMI